MTQTDRNVLVQCAEMLAIQTAALAAHYDNMQIAQIETTRPYVAQVRRFEPHLQHMRIIPPPQTGDQDVFDTLRKILELAAKPTL